MTKRSIDHIDSKSWYKWVGMRKRWLKDHPICARCKRDRNSVVVATIVDHKIPHRGNLALFLDYTNFQSLCQRCHSGTKQREDNRGYSDAMDIDGRYTDPKHPRYGF